MAGNIFLIAESKDGHLKRVFFEILGQLQKLGVNPTVVLPSAPGGDTLAQEITRFGPSKIVLLEHADLKQYSTEGYANSLYRYLSQENPSAIVMGASSQGRDLLPRLAAKFQVGIASDCTEFNISGNNFTVRRPIYAGKCSVEVNFNKTPAVFSVRPNIFPAPVNPSKSAQVEKILAHPGKIRAKIVEFLSSGEKKVDLTEADIIVSGGRALKSADNFKIIYDCASAIGGAAGASRAAVDAGYAPHDIQVGQTGKTVGPKLYIACGISGAIQHLAGMRTSKVVVAVNKDPEAPIFQKADYGLVADLFDVVPLLTAEFKKLKAQS